MNAETKQEFEDQLDELPQGTTLLHGQYQIEHFLGRGGFGITYLARDSLDREVVIKECFPTALCYRIAGKVHPKSDKHNQQYGSVLRHFLREARQLARLKHPSIVGVHQVFEENNTAYMALDYIDGVDMLTILEDEPSRLKPQVLHQALMTALEAIEYIHGLSILHRDISPDNFLLDAHNNVTLIDFGAARENADLQKGVLSAMIAVKDGYSPHEFYLTEDTQSASSDLYSLAATFYHFVTGKAPPDSQERLAALAADCDDPCLPLTGSSAPYSEGFLASIDRALSVLPENRIQTASEWIAILRSTQVQPVLKLEARWDADLQDKIAQLVKDVNCVLEPKLPRALEDKNSNPAEIADEPPEDQVQPVDIFGNRIDDVKAWLRDQDKKPLLRSKPDPSPKTKARAKAATPKAEIDPQDPKPAKTRPTRSIFGNLLQRRPKDASALQN